MSFSSRCVRLVLVASVGAGAMPWAVGAGAVPSVPGAPALTMSSLQVLEGDEGATTVDLQLFLAQPLPVPTQVVVTAVPGASAASGTDYVLAQSVVTIPAGAADAPVPVQIVGDRAPEADKAVTFAAAAAGGALGTATGTLTIVDDDRTQRVDLSPTGQQADGNSSYPSTSLDGRTVSFVSSATNLTPDAQGPGDYNGTQDVFVRDLLTGVTVKAYVNSSGGDPSDGVTSEALSGNGRYVSFSSAATDLLPGRTAPYGRYNVYRRDLLTGVTDLVSAMPDGSFPTDSSDGGDMSADGRYVAFVTNANVAGQRADGTWIDNNDRPDIYVRDMVSGVSRLASIGPSGLPVGGCNTGLPRISADGSKVVFVCTNDFDNGRSEFMVYDVATQQTSVVNIDPYGTVAAVPLDEVAIDAQGRYAVVMTRPTGVFAFDLYRLDLRTGDLQLVSRRPDGGRSVGEINSPQITAAGDIVTFSSTATDLVANGPKSGTYNIYATNMRTDQVFWISQGNLGTEPDKQCQTAVAFDGLDAVFSSYADNLVAGDTNGVSDVFVRRLAVLPDLRVDAPTIAADPLAARVALVPVSLSAVEAQPTQVHWQLSGGAGPTSGTVTIPAGALSAFIPVTVAAGAQPGSVHVTIDSPGGPAVGTGSATLTIT